jgi:hypothetical protein
LLGVQLSARDQQDRDGPPQQSSIIWSVEAHRCRNDNESYFAGEIHLNGSEDGLPNLSGLLGSCNAAEAEGGVEMDAASWPRRSIPRNPPLGVSSRDGVRHGTKNGVAWKSDEANG